MSRLSRRLLLGGLFPLVAVGALPVVPVLTRSAPAPHPVKAAPVVPRALTVTRGTWPAARGSGGTLGFPVAKTHAVPGGLHSDFQHGTVVTP